MANILCRQFQCKGLQQMIGALRKSSVTLKLDFPAQCLTSFSAIKPVENKYSNGLLPVKNQLELAKRFNATNIKEHDEHDHDHVKHWTAERILSLSLLGSIPAAVLFPSPVFEYILALALTVHSHWGVEAMVIDYIRPSVVGEKLSRATVAFVKTVSAMTLGLLFYFIYTDVGLINVVKMLWKL